MLVPLSLYSYKRLWRHPDTSILKNCSGEAVVPNDIQREYKFRKQCNIWRFRRQQQSFLNGPPKRYAADGNELLAKIFLDVISWAGFSSRFREIWVPVTGNAYRRGQQLELPMQINGRFEKNLSEELSVPLLLGRSGSQGSRSNSKVKFFWWGSLLEDHSIPTRSNSGILKCVWTQDSHLTGPALPSNFVVLFFPCARWIVGCP